MSLDDEDLAELLLTHLLAVLNFTCCAIEDSLAELCRTLAFVISFNKSLANTAEIRDCIVIIKAHEELHEAYNL